MTALADRKAASSPCQHARGAEGSPPTTAGWYPDPYQPNAQRWFDGTAWTTHAVGREQSDPDDVLEDQWRRTVGGDHAQQEWIKGFSPWDTAIPRGSEPPFDFRGGLTGFAATRWARGAARYSATHPGFRIWHLACLVPPVLLLFAWIDPTQRRDLEIGAVVVAGVCLLLGLASVSVHRHWTDLGRQGPADAGDQPRIRRDPPWLWILLIGGGLIMLVISLFLPVFPVSPPSPRALTPSERVSTISAPTTKVTPTYCGNRIPFSNEPDVTLNQSNGGEVATAYVGDLVEIDFADGQPTLSSLRLLCFDEVVGNSDNGGPMTDGSMLYEAVKPGPEVVVLNHASGSTSVIELSIVVAPAGSKGSPAGFFVRVAGLLMLALGAFGLVVGWWGALPPRSRPR